MAITKTWKASYERILGFAPREDGNCDLCPAAKVCVGEWGKEMSFVSKLSHKTKAKLIWPFPCGEIVDGKSLP